MNSIGGHKQPDQQQSSTISDNKVLKNFPNQHQMDNEYAKKATNQISKKLQLFHARTTETTRTDKDVNRDKRMGSYSKSNPSSRHLTFHFYQYRPLSEQLKDLIKCLKDGYIQSLTLDFSLCRIINNKDLKLLGKVLAKVPYLEKLIIRDASFFRTTAEGYKLLADELTKLKYLTELSLNLNPLQNPKQSFDYILEKLKKLSNLKTLNIAIPRFTKLSDEALKSFANGIQQLTNLTELSLSIDGPNDEPDRFAEQGISDLIKSLEQLGNLRKLSLNFLRCKLSSQNLDTLATTLNKLNQLISLSVKLNELNDTYADDSCKKLAQSIASLSQLRKLTLAMVGVLSPQSISDFSHTIGQLLQLNHLNVDFSNNCYLTPELWGEMAKSIANLNELSALELNLSWCLVLKDQAIEKLAQVIQNPKLNSLSLNLEGIKLSNAGLKALAKVLENLREQLKQCNINLHDCSQRIKDKIFSFTSNDITILTNAICNLRLLTSLTLGLELCPVTDNNLNELANSFKPLADFSQLQLTLSRCSKLSTSGIKRFAQDLPKLEELTMTLPFPQGADKIAENELTQALMSRVKINSRNINAKIAYK
jgi:hypothetical protein